MKQELWLSRDDNSNAFYNVHDENPELNYTGYFTAGYGLPIFSLNPISFHKMFTARLRKGRKRRIKRILIELED